MRDVGAPINVVVAHCIDQRDIGEISNGLVPSQTITDNIHTQIRTHARPLLIGKFNEEGGSVDTGAVVQVDPEEVVLWVRGETRVLACVQPASEVRDLRDGLVVDRDVVDLEVGLPVGKGGVGGVADCRGVGAVDEGDHIRVLGRDLADEPGDAVERRQQTQRLVRMLVAVAPRALSLVSMLCEG